MQERFALESVIEFVEWDYCEQIIFVQYHHYAVQQNTSHQQNADVRQIVIARWKGSK